MFGFHSRMDDHTPSIPSFDRRTYVSVSDTTVYTLHLERGPVEVLRVKLSAAEVVGFSGPPSLKLEMTSSLGRNIFVTSGINAGMD